VCCPLLLVPFEERCSDPDELENECDEHEHQTQN
jgi:hypothetical protein